MLERGRKSVWFVHWLYNVLQLTEDSLNDYEQNNRDRGWRPINRRWAR